MIGFIRAIDGKIHGFLPVSPEGLALSRIGFALYFLVVGLPTFSRLSANPPGFYYPPPLSIAAFASGFPDLGVLFAIDVTICVCFVFLLVGFQTPWVSILLTVTWLVGNSFRYSFGKIDHEILPVVTPAIMAFSGWGNHYSVDAQRRTARRVAAWPLSMLALLTAFGFFSAGLPKLLVWLDFDVSTQGTHSWLISGWYQHRDRLLAPIFMKIRNPYFWETMDTAAVVFEVGFLFSLVRRSLFRTFLFVAVFFHLINFLMLNIGFLPHLPVYAILMPWERVVPHLPRQLFVWLGRRPSLGLVVTLIVLFVPLYAVLPRLSSDPALSHLGVLAESTHAFDFPWLAQLVLLPASAVGALVLAGMPVGKSNAVTLLSDGSRVVFFDGVCNLCNGYVDFVLRHDRTGQILFASLQSDVGRLVEFTTLGTRAVSNSSKTIVLLDSDGLFYERSDAILKIVTGLGGAYRLLFGLWLVPRVIRDLMYRLVSRSRYQVFGKRETCRVPTAEERRRFVDATSRVESGKLKVG